MPTFAHQVPEPARGASHWNAGYAAYETPDGRFWIYTDDPHGEGVSWQDGTGHPIAVAVWLVD